MSVPIWQCVVLVDAHMRVKRIFYEEGEEEGSKHDDEMGQEDVLAEGEDQHLQHQLDNVKRDGHSVQNSTADEIYV